MHNVRVYSDLDGESHFEDVEAPAKGTKTVTGVAVSEWFSGPLGDGFNVQRVNPASDHPASPASGEWGPWHPEDRSGFIVLLAGKLQMKVSSGEMRRVQPRRHVAGGRHSRQGPPEPAAHPRNGTDLHPARSLEELKRPVKRRQKGNTQ